MLPTVGRQITKQRYFNDTNFRDWIGKYLKNEFYENIFCNPRTLAILYQITVDNRPFDMEILDTAGQGAAKYFQNFITKIF